MLSCKPSATGKRTLRQSKSSTSYSADCDSGTEYVTGQCALLCPSSREGNYYYISGLPSQSGVCSSLGMCYRSCLATCREETMADGRQLLFLPETYPQTPLPGRQGAMCASSLDCPTGFACTTYATATGTVSECNAYVTYSAIECNEVATP